MAFITGITGQFFRQFAVTIAVSTVISAFNSLTLSPALAALLLKPRDKHSAPPLPWPAFGIAGGWLAWVFLTPRAEAWLQPHGWWLDALPYFVAACGAVAGIAIGWPLNRLLAWVFALFNHAFDGLGSIYTWIVGKLLTLSVVVVVVYGGLLVLTYQQVEQTPKGFIPSQDMGYLFCAVQLPDSASLDAHRNGDGAVGQIARSDPGIDHTSEISGTSFLLNSSGSNFGTSFIRLKDYSERRDPNLASDKILARLTQQFEAKIVDARAMVLPPPPVRGVGRAGGFMLMLEDRGDVGPAELQRETESLVATGNQTKGLMALFSAFRANVPQLKVEPDTHECLEKQVSLRDFADALQVFQGSLYVNDFNLFGRTWQVIVQAEQQYRNQIDDIPRLRVAARTVRWCRWDRWPAFAK